MKIELTDVTLRDGLQSEGRAIQTQAKVDLFQKLKTCGYSRLEITSFVHPKWIPQLADSEAFCKAIFQKTSPDSRPELMAFVPNLKGLERFLVFPISWASVFIAATETFNQKNVNASQETTLKEIESVVQKAHASGRKVRVYISTAFGCPYEGPVSSQKILDITRKVADLGPDEIALSDTIGVGLPEQVSEIFEECQGFYPIEKMALHCHNTYGLALLNVQAAWAQGVMKFDGSTGGIGGCPYAVGATGNVATEDVAYLFFRKTGLPHNDSRAVKGVLEALKAQGLGISGNIGRILLQGGALYGVK